MTTEKRRKVERRGKDLFNRSVSMYNTHRARPSKTSFLLFGIAKESRMLDLRKTVGEVIHSPLIVNQEGYFICFQENNEGIWLIY